MGRIEGIFLDIDDVLYDSTGFSENARLTGLEQLQKYFPEIDMEKLKNETKAVLSENGSNYDSLFDDVLKRLCISEQDPRFYPAVMSAVYRYHLKKFVELEPFPDVKRTLDELKSKNVKLGIISNGITKKQWYKLILLELDCFFRPEYVIISERVGYQKPEPEIYKIALESMGIYACNAAHCDDRPEYVEGAMNVGMTGIRILKGKYKNKQGKADYEVSELGEILKIF